MSTDLSVKDIGQRICFVRGHRVMLDSDLADLYDVETKNLNKAVKRNIDRFPEDFMFQLVEREYDSLRFQFGTLKSGRGEHRKYLPQITTKNSKPYLQLSASLWRSDRPSLKSG